MAALRRSRTWLSLFRQCSIQHHVVRNYCRPITAVTSPQRMGRVCVLSEDRFANWSWCLYRGYAKKKIKHKHEKKAHEEGADIYDRQGYLINLPPGEMEGYLDLDQLKAEMREVEERMKQEYMQNLSLRTSIASFETLSVDLGDDGQFPLNQIAQLVQKNPQLFLVQAPGKYISYVKKAIEESGMNVNPTIDGNTVIVPIPKVTLEHREALALSAKQLFMKHKDRIRKIGQKHKKKVEQAKKVKSENTYYIMNEMVTAITKSYTQELEEIMTQKQKELKG